MGAQVKSAIRVLQVLEYFDGIRREAGVVEIARALGFPPSSTTCLLQSMVDQGYLAQDTRRLYRPTPRVTLLGAWVAPTLSPGGPVTTLMEELSDATGETIILGIPAGMTVRYIHVVPAKQPMRLHVGPGETRPIALSGIGRMFLSMMGDDEVRRIVFRHNQTQRSDETRLALAAVRRDIEQIRSAGYAVSIDRISRGAGLVCVALPSAADTGPLAVAVGGLSSFIRANAGELARRMKDAIRRHVGGAALYGRAATVDTRRKP